MERARQGGPKEDLHFSTVEVGLRKFLRHQQLERVFQDTSRRVGIYEHIVTLVRDKTAGMQLSTPARAD